MVDPLCKNPGPALKPEPNPEPYFPIRTRTLNFGDHPNPTPNARRTNCDEVALNTAPEYVLVSGVREK